MLIVELLKAIRPVLFIVAALMVLVGRVWLGDQVRQEGEHLEKLHTEENKLIGRNHFLDANQKRQRRVDNLSEMARNKLNLVQPVPEALIIKVPKH